MLLYHTGLVGLLENTTGDFYLRSGAGTAIHIEPAAGADSIIANAGGNVELYYDDVKKLETNLTGASVIGDLDLNGDLDVQDFVTLCSTSGNVVLGSSTNPNANISIYAGTSPGTTNYFQLRASSNEAYITNTSGSGSGGGMNISARTTLGLYSGGTGGQYISFIGDSNGAANLYYQSLKKLECTATGVTITGTLVADGLSGPVTGNADTATALETARTIAGQSFDGTANITIAATDLSDTDQALATTSDVTFNTVTSDSATFDGETIVKGNLLKRTAAGSTVVALRDDYLRVYDSPVSYDDYKISLEKTGAGLFGAASNSTGNNGVLVGGNNGSLNIYTDRYTTDCFQILNTTGSGTNIALKAYGNGDVEIAGIIQSNTKSAGNIELDSTGAFTSPPLKLFANTGDISTAGTLTFTGQTNSATGTASSDALDHYEEGTWTPTWGSTTGSITNITYDVQSGWYTRIGNIVYVTCRLRSTATDTSGAGGGLLVTGLPFVARNPQGTGGAAAYSGIDFPDTSVHVVTEIRENTIQFYAGLYTLDNGNFGNLGPGSLQSSGQSEIRVSFFYMTDT